MENNKSKREELLKKIQEFRLLDDDFMSRVFDENIECTELILRIILNKPDIKVSEVHTQREIKNLLGHSVRLDIAARDTDNEPIDVEIQRSDKGAGVTETGKPLGDGTHIVYVNGAYRDESPIGKLMHDFSCKNPADMYYKPLADQVRYYKEDAKGVEAMCRIVEDIVEKEKREEKIAMIAKMKRVGKLSNEDIAEITGFTVEEIEGLTENNAAVAN